MRVGAGNTPPTEQSVRAKLGRSGSLFAADEVGLLVAKVDELRVRLKACRDVKDYLERRYVPTNRA